MISWAQNAEDVVLARALPQKRGFYVDLGAADPVVASVTKHFYDLGWSGINIDPRPDAIERLQAARPRDLNLQLAASDRAGTATFQINEEDRDQSFLGAPSATTTSIDVTTRTLDQILEDAGVAAISFVKIDVEGAEQSVLEGFDLPRWRPRVVVIEATAPWSHHRVDKSWRYLLEERGYVEASFDGVNLFFAHESEDPEFFELLAPVSVLDEYTRPSAQLLQERVVELEMAYAAVEKLATDREHALLEAAEYATRLEQLSADQATALAAAEEYVQELEHAVSASAATKAPTSERSPRYRRVAVVGPANSIARETVNAIAAALGAQVVEPTHPSEISWDELPARAVIVLPMHATSALQAHLLGARVVPTTVRPDARLVAALHDEADRRQPLAEWLAGRDAATLWRNVMSWSRWPRTVRFDELSAVLDLVGPLVPVTPGAGASKGDLHAIERFIADTH